MGIISGKHGLQVAMKTLRKNDRLPPLISLLQLGELKIRDEKETMYGAQDVKSLADALRNNTTVETIHFYGLGKAMEGAHATDFFHSLSTVTSLKRIVIMDYITLTVLLKVVAHATKLEALVLNHVEIEGLVEADAWKIFQRHPSLHTVKLVAFYMENLKSFHSLVGCLSQMRYLKTLKLQGDTRGGSRYAKKGRVTVDSMGRISKDSIRALCASSTIRKLSLEVQDGRNVHFSTMMSQLQQKTALQELEMPVDTLHGKMATNFAEMLRRNTTLTKLCLKVRCYPGPRGSAVPKAKEGLVRVAEALKEDNRTLKSLSIRSATDEYYNRSILDAFVQMAAKNPVLEMLQLLDPSATFSEPLFRLLQETICFFLQRNVRGQDRHDILTAEWVDILAKTSSDPNLLFFFLSLEPSLCSNALL